MLRGSWVLGLLVALCVAASAYGQMGVKDMVKRQLEQAQADRNEQLQNAVEPAPTPPAATLEKAGWTERTTPDGTKVRLYVAHPFVAANATPALPALLVLQEWWGVNDDIQQRTDEFAAKGFYAVAVDLYDGKVTKDPTEAAALRTKLTDPAALLRMKTGLAYLTDLANKKIVDPQRVGVIGWCMGGQYALQLAVNDPRVKATAIFYGPLITDATKLKNLKGPVLGIFGNEDKNPSPEDVNKFEAALQEDKVAAEIHRYDHAGHAFASRSAAAMGAYKEEPAKDAWEKAYAWLDKTLKAK